MATSKTTVKAATTTTAIPRSPFRDVEPLQPPATLHRGYLNDHESGAVKPAAAVPKAFINGVKKAAVAHADLPRMDPPQWARRLIASKADPSAVIQAAAERAAKTPNEETLREVQAVLNELGRDPKHGESLKRIAVPQHLDRILK